MLLHDVPLQKYLPSLPRREPLIKDHSAVKEFMTCKRKYFYRMVLGRVAKKSNLDSIFAWGAAIHKFAEIYSYTWDFKAATAEAIKLYKTPNPDFPKWSHLDLVRFTRTIDLVSKLLDEERSKGFVKTLAVEQPVNFEFPDGMSGGGRFDAIIRMGSNTWIRDWKTTTKRIDYFRSSLDPNDQATRYIYALSLAQGWSSSSPKDSTKAAGVEFVIIQNLKPTKTAPNHPKVEKVQISRSNQQLVQFEKEQLFIHKMMDTCRNEDMWPMEPTNCSFCDYQRVCRTGSDGSKEAILKAEYLFQPWDHQKVSQEAE